MSAPDSELGAQLGRYVLEKHLASGGMADVWLASVSGPVGFRKRLVLKTLRRQMADDPAMVEMFQQEARLAALLAHPNIVQIFDFGQSEQGFFIAMEYVAGADLRRIQRKLNKDQRLIPVALLVVTLHAVCEGLAYAHGLSDDDGQPLGLVHRDISPDNIMVTFSGATKILDFGIAKANTSAETDAGIIKGKHAYLSPEQLLERGADGRSDVYSLGVVAYELLTGHRPFRGKTSFHIMQGILQGTVEPVRELAPWVPASLAEVVHKAMARELEHRYASAAEMASDLAACMRELDQVPSTSAIAMFVRDLFSPHSAPPEKSGTVSLVPVPPVRSMSPIVPAKPQEVRLPSILPSRHKDEIVVELSDEDLVTVYPTDEQDRDGAESEPTIDPPEGLDRAWDLELEASFPWIIPVAEGTGDQSEQPQSASGSRPADEQPAEELPADPPSANASAEGPPLREPDKVAQPGEQASDVRPWDAFEHRGRPADSRLAEAWDALSANRQQAMDREARSPAIRLFDKVDRGSEGAPSNAFEKRSPWDRIVEARQASLRPPTVIAREAGDTPSRKRLSPKHQAADAFEEGLRHYRASDYQEALAAWDEACRLAPDDRRYAVNLRKLKELLSKEKA